MNHNVIQDHVTATSFPWIVLIASPITILLENRKEDGDALSLIIALPLAFLLTGMFRGLGIARIFPPITDCNPEIMATHQARGTTPIYALKPMFPAAMVLY